MYLEPIRGYNATLADWFIRVVKSLNEAGAERWRFEIPAKTGVLRGPRAVGAGLSFGFQCFYYDLVLHRFYFIVLNIVFYFIVLNFIKFKTGVTKCCFNLPPTMITLLLSTTSNIAGAAGKSSADLNAANPASSSASTGASQAAKSASSAKTRNYHQKKASNKSSKQLNNTRAPP